MTTGDAHDDPVERLLDVFLYAPIGMLATGGENLDEYIRKGRRSAMAARTVGEFALRGVDDRVAKSVGDLEGMAREFLRIVLTNASPAARRGGSDGGAARSGEATTTSASPETEPDGTTGIDDLIAGFDGLTAKDVVGRLDGLDAAALARVEAHERANRGRKTILDRIDRLRR